MCEGEAVIVFPHIMERQNMITFVGSLGGSKPFALVCCGFFFLIITTVVIMLQELFVFVFFLT
jgi:hypothetical protein